MSRIHVSDAEFAFIRFILSATIASYFLLRRWQILNRFREVSAAYRQGRPRSFQIAKVIDRLMAPGTLQVGVTLIYPLIVITVLKMPPSTFLGWATALFALASISIGSAASLAEMRNQLSQLQRHAELSALHRAIQSFDRRQKVLIERMRQGDDSARREFVTHYQGFPLQSVLAGDTGAAKALIAHQHAMDLIDGNS